MILNRVKRRLYQNVGKYTSKVRHNWCRKRLRNTTISIISQNCIGGVISHDLGLQFLSPTVNLYMTSEDFITFVENLRGFQNAPLTFVDSDRSYPVATCCCGEAQIRLYFVHYPSSKVAEEKWHERFCRINYENIGVVMTDRDGLTDSILKRYEALPYKKVLFSARPLGIADTVYVKEFKGEKQVGDLIPFANVFGKRRYEEINIVDWMNA